MKRETWTVNYAGSDRALEVTVVTTWARGDIPAPVMSASSGPKDYVKNDIFAVFEADPAIDTVALVRGAGPAFSLVCRGSEWFDMSGRPVNVRQAKQGEQGVQAA